MGDTSGKSIRLGYTSPLRLHLVGSGLVPDQDMKDIILNVWLAWLKKNRIRNFAMEQSG